MFLHTPDALPQKILFHLHICHKLLGKVYINDLNTGVQELNTSLPCKRCSEHVIYFPEVSRLNTHNVPEHVRKWSNLKGKHSLLENQYSEHLWACSGHI